MIFSGKDNKKGGIYPPFTIYHVQTGFKWVRSRFNQFQWAWRIEGRVRIIAYVATLHAPIRNTGFRPIRHHGNGLLPKLSLRRNQICAWDITVTFSVLFG